MKIYTATLNGDISPRRTTYNSPRQGAAPEGWKCVGVAGYFETSREGYAALRKQGRVH